MLLIVLYNRLLVQSQCYMFLLPSDSQPQAFMLSFTILGFFALASGRGLQTIKPGTTIWMWHAHYMTTIQCISPLLVLANLYIYSLINDTLHLNNTNAFIVAQVHVPPSIDILLDAIHIVPCPGDPSLNSYDDTVPDFQFPKVYGTCVVLTPHETMPNRSTAFSIALTKYVHDVNQQSNVQYVDVALHSHVTNLSHRCILNWTVPHWRNTPIPTSNTVIHFMAKKVVFKCTPPLVCLLQLALHLSKWPPQCEFYITYITL